MGNMAAHQQADMLDHQGLNNLSGSFLQLCIAVRLLMLCIAAVVGCAMQRCHAKAADLGEQVDYRVWWAELFLWRSTW